MAGKFYVGLVEILSGLVKVPVTPIQMFYRVWDWGVVRLVDKQKLAFRMQSINVENIYKKVDNYR